MKCNNCNKNMELVRFNFFKGSQRVFERFIYECKSCGIIDYPKANINHSEELQKKKKKILQDLVEFKMVATKEAVEYLVSQDNYFLILSLFHRRNITFIRSPLEFNKKRFLNNAL
jgi:hypothetical protein